VSNGVKIWAHCYSEKESVSISFGTSIDATMSIEEFHDTDWIDEGLAESFWENYDEFVPGIEKAKTLLNNNPKLTMKAVLLDVFGHFFMSYEKDGEEIQLEFDINPDEVMYSLLEN
jgi:hypothetical protein